jgi:ABC-type multidrug transport system ATPase subunit
MKEPAQVFTYTARRGAYLTTVCTLAFLFLTDVGLLVFLIFLFIHTTVLKLVLLALVAALYFSAIGLWLLPLWTKHRLTETHLSLHYGRALKVNIPRTAIAAAQPVRERLTMLEPLAARYDAKKGRIVAASSDQGQVLLRLDKPHALKVGRSTVLADTLLINVDDRLEFLTALGTPGAAPVAAPPQMLVQQDEPHSLPAMRGIPPSTDSTPPSAATALRIEGLTRRFGSLAAVDHLHLALRQGEIYGFLGSNGAGKTTTMKMLVGVLQPSEGRAWIAGHDVWTQPLTAKAAFGYVADRSLLYERLTGREFLAFLGQLRGMSLEETEERVEDLLALLELTEHADRLCGAYSFGMKRKLSLAGALLHQPPVLILDEPLNGLDPRSARRLKDLFAERASGGATILLSTHDLATAKAVCHRIGIMHRGRLLASGRASELRQVASASDLESVFLSLTADHPQVEVPL